MALDLYRRKRDFTRTQEPEGTESAAAGHSYLIQKHAARRLHYDLRLELDGVLKSWAVTKGPSLVPGEKRLAVHVEDHPLDYGSFEGTIPKGEYGGGTVMLWDRGSWEPIGDPARGYRKGHLEFELHGDKLHGRWHLVRMAKRRGEKADNWLLIKAEDDAARPEGAADILEERPDSVKTGRSMEAIATGAASAPEKARTTAKKAGSKGPAARAATRSTVRSRKAESVVALPDFIEPQLATLVAKAPVGTAWIHEIKFDGYRLQARIDKSAKGKGRVKLLTRSGLDWTPRFGKALVEALESLPVETALIDGELVVESSAGVSNFSLLQHDLAEGRADRFLFYAFDLLHLDGRDLTGRPLTERKQLLEQMLAGADDGLRYSEHLAEDGDAMLRHACRLSLEGLVSKRAGAPYRPGRGRDWVKSKCAFRQEFVIGGFTPSTSQNNAIGSLVLGVYEAGKLVPVGRVGTGFSRELARGLHARLAKITRDRSPFGQTLTAEERRGVTFVAPELVAEVEFRGWTGDQHLRHAAFRGLREDKPAREIVRETPAKGEAMAVDRTAPRSRVKLTHPDRIYWPAEGITKQGLADYYADIWRFIAPFVVVRPLALLRCPDGIEGQAFFQKHSWRGMNKAIKIATDKDAEELLYIDDLDGLIALVQSAALEIHPWGAPLTDIERPDQLIFDLDPGEAVGWNGVVAGAREIRARLEAQGLPAFVKTSGGKGLHVVVPLKPTATWETAKPFAKALADSLAADDPERYIAVATKARRKGRIFVDYLRNGRGATAVAAYCPRARPGAGVSMPVAWDELDALTGGAHFTLTEAPARLANLDADPWADFRAAAAPLPTARTGKGRGRKA
ncbi:DNA ligase D [Ancylobacter sp. IITR112]|uniref:DNA ligase D n=1 Tax=Ancylobacter sp. IITR112 TaxID=3138073 RepID=UPI00352A9B72